MNLENKLESISNNFKELEEKKNEHKKEISEIEIEQYRLQGEHRVISSMVEELTVMTDEETN